MKRFLLALSILATATSAFADDCEVRIDGVCVDGGGGITIGGTITGGTDTRVLFNDSGVIGEDDGLTYNKTTNAITAGSLEGTKIGSSSAADATFNAATIKNAATLGKGSGTGYLSLKGQGGTNNEEFIIDLETNANSAVFRTGSTGLDTFTFVDFKYTLYQTSSGPAAVFWGYSDKTNSADIEDAVSPNSWSFVTDVGSVTLTERDYNAFYHTDLSPYAKRATAYAAGLHGNGQRGFVAESSGSTSTSRTPVAFLSRDKADTGTADHFRATLSSTDVFKVTHDGRVHIGSGAGFIPTDDTKYINSQTVTSIGTSFSPINIFKLVDEVDAVFAPTADTNTGFGGPPYNGVTLYAAMGGRGILSGTANFNGGLPITSNQIPVSVLAGFNVISDERTSGTLDAAAGVIYQSTHGGYGATDSTLIGGLFDAGTEDSAGAGSPTGSLDTAIGGYFSSGGSGVDITNAISLKAFEPNAFDSGEGAGVPTITNKTAALIDGTFSVTTSNVATGTSLTNMAVATSSIRMTGTTTGSIHGIHGDTFSKHLNVYNASTGIMTIENQSTTDATAANRIIVPTGNAYRLNPGYSAQFVYDPTQSRWLVTSPIVESGVYTPTLSNIANVDSSTAYECQYMRVGNTVTVSGMITVDPTVISTLTQVNMTLPIASNFGTLQDVGGTGANGAYSARLLADTTNDRAQFYYIATDVGSQDWQFTYTYQII